MLDAFVQFEWYIAPYVAEQSTALNFNYCAMLFATVLKINIYLSETKQIIRNQIRQTKTFK